MGAFLGDDAAYFSMLLKPGKLVLPVSQTLMPRLECLFADAYAALSAGFAEQNIICAAQAVRHMFGLLFFNNPAFHPRLKTIVAEKINAACELMRSHVDGILRVQEMAQSVGMSTTHFTRLMRQHTGFTPIEYFIHLKMQRACRFLSLTQQTIKEIADRIGYEDAYYFSRVFRKVIGISPTKYRETKRG